MTSLADVYDRRDGRGYQVGHRRLMLGMGLFLAGTILAVVALVVASTEILESVGVGLYGARRIAGVLGGLGIPAVFLGLFVVLPASERVRAAAGVGAIIAILGVILFSAVYPHQWLGAGVERHYTFETAAVYFIGALLTFWCLFVGIANFKARNDPGGTIDFEIRKAGRTRVVEVEPDTSRQPGGVGVLGGLTADTGTTVSDGGETATQSGATGDTGVDILSEDPNPTATVDRYCGNCSHFEYRPAGKGMQPYCGYREEAMDDMEPCEAWTSRQEQAATSPDP